MRQLFEYRSIYLPGLGEEQAENAATSPDALDSLLRERVRTYNRLGAEGWMLIAEHQEETAYSVVATFRRPTDVQEPAKPANPTDTPMPVAPPAKPAPSYPTLQPDPASPDTFRLVWER